MRSPLLFVSHEGLLSSLTVKVTHQALGLHEGLSYSTGVYHLRIPLSRLTTAIVARTRLFHWMFSSDENENNGLFRLIVKIQQEGHIKFTQLI